MHSYNNYIINLIKIFGIYIFFFQLYLYIINTFFALQDTFNYKLIEFIKNIIIIFWLWIFLFLWKINVVNVAIIFVIWIIISLAYWLFKLFKKNKQIFSNINSIKKQEIKENKNYIKEFFLYSFLFILWWQAFVLLSQTDQQMILFFIWKESAWYYSNYLSLLSIPLLLLWPFSSFLLPIISELKAKKQNKKIELLINKTINIIIVFWLYIWTILAIFWPFISYILFSKKFIFSWTLLFYSW